MKIVLFIVDSLRADTPGFAGGSAETPVLDALSERAAVFTRAHCSGSWTIPSMVSMMTGCFPHRTGVCNWRHRPHPDVPFLPDLLAAHGLPTRVFVPNPRWAFAGWPAPPETGDSQDLDAVEAALADDRPGLVLVHHWWTHIPYTPRPSPWSAHKAVADKLIDALHHAPALVAPRLRGLYERAVSHWSEVLLPRWLGALERCGQPVLGVVTADHGESWGELVPGGAPVEHIFDLHGRWLEDATTAVPLIVWGQTAEGPVRAGQISEGFARGLDLGPTLAAAAGLPDLGPNDGRSMLPSLLHGAPTGVDAALTIGSHNTWHPEEYPRDGRVMWRTWSLRTEAGRETWQAPSGEPPPHFAAGHAEARGPWGTELDHSPEPEDRRLGRQLRTLGYG